MSRIAKSSVLFLFPDGSIREREDRLDTMEVMAQGAGARLFVELDPHAIWEVFAVVETTRKDGKEERRTLRTFPTKRAAKKAIKAFRILGGGYRRLEIERRCKVVAAKRTILERIDFNQSERENEEADDSEVETSADDFGEGVAAANGEAVSA